MSQNFQNFVKVQVDSPDATGADLRQLCVDAFETDITENTSPNGNRVYGTYDLVTVQHNANRGSQSEHIAVTALYSQYLDMLLDITQERLRGHVLSRGDRPVDPDIVSRTPILFTRDNDSMVVRNGTAEQLIKDIAKEEFMAAISQCRQQYETYLAVPLNYVVFGISTTIDHDPMNRPAITFILDIAVYRFGDESRQTSELVQPLGSWATRPVGHLSDTELSQWENINVHH